MTNTEIFTTGGTVQAGNGIYIQRAVDDQLLAVCRERRFAYLLTPRQMGKSSLMVETADRLRQENIRSVIVDLSKIGVLVTPDQWYLGLLAEIGEQLDLSVNVESWWRERHPDLGLTHRLTAFFQDVVLRDVKEPIVIFVDEVDTTLSLNFTDDFFAAIRFFYNGRAHHPEFNRLSFVLIGVATPGDLIKDPERTPFNIGTRINLIDFTPDEALHLAAGFGISTEQARQALMYVMEWTNGHPVLTQRLCKALAREGRDWSRAEVDGLVNDIFFGEKSADDNIGFVRDMLTERIPGTIDRNNLLTVYRDVLRGRNVSDEESSLVKNHLKLAGIVDSKNGRLQVRNRVYAQVFNKAWLRAHMPVNWVRRLTRVAAAFVVTFIFLTAVAAPYAWQQKSKAEVALKKEQILRGDLERANAVIQQALTNERAAHDAAENEKQKAVAAENEASKGKEEVQAALTRESEQRAVAVRERNRAQQAEYSSFISKLVLQAKSLKDEPPKTLEQRVVVSKEAYLNAARAEAAQGNSPVNLGSEQPAPMSVVSYQNLMESAALLPRPLGLAYAAKPQNFDLMFSGDGRELIMYPALETDQRVFARWDTRTKVVQEKSLPENISILLYRPDDSYVFRRDQKTFVHLPGKADVELEDASFTVIRSVDMSSEGDYVLVFSAPRSDFMGDEGEFGLGVWRVSDGKRIFTTKPASGVSAALSPDGKFAYLVGSGGLSVWEVNKGSLIKTDRILEAASKSERPLSALLKGATFSLDRTRVVIWNGYIAEIWALSPSQMLNQITFSTPLAGVANNGTGDHLGKEKGANYADGVLAFSSDGNALVTQGIKSNTVTLWVLDYTGNGVGTGELQLEDDQPFIAAKFSADGRSLVTQTENGLRVWDVANRFESYRLNSDEIVKAKVGLSPDGGLLAAMTNSGVKVWSLSDDANPLRRIIGDVDTAVSWGRHRQYKIVREPNQPALSIWDSNLGRAVATVAFDDYAKWADVSKDGQVVAACVDPDGSSTVFHVWRRSGASISWPHSTPCYEPAMSDDGKFVAAFADTKTIVVWDASNGTPGDPKTLHIDYADALAFVPNSHSLLVTSNGEPNPQGQLWSFPEGKAVGGPIDKVANNEDAFAFSRDGKYLAIEGSGGNSVRIIETATGTTFANLPHTESLNSIDLTGQDGAYKLVTAGAGDHVLRVWEWRGRQQPTVTIKIKNDVGDPYVTISPNGRYMVSGADGEAARIWEITNSAKPVEVARIMPPGGEGFALFSPNDEFLYTLGANSGLTLWQWQPKEVICQAQDRLPNADLTSDQWREILLTDEIRFIKPGVRPNATCPAGP